MRKLALLLFLFTLLNPAKMLHAQHHWLVADPTPLPKKSPLRLSLVSGDSLKPDAGSEPVQLQRFGYYFGKNDSLDLLPLATGTTALVPAGEAKGAGVAGAVANLPQTTLQLSQLKGQLTKEQKAILAQLDTAKLRGGIPATRIHYAKVHVNPEGSKDKAQAHRRQLNHELEIIPNKDPAELKAGQEMVIQVLLHQRLLPNHKLTVWHQDKNGKLTHSNMKTGTYGMRVFSLRKPGKYLVQVAQQGPHRFGFSEETVWQDLEASYYFEIPE